MRAGLLATGERQKDAVKETETERNKERESQREKQRERPREIQRGTATTNNFQEFYFYFYFICWFNFYLFR